MADQKLTSLMPGPNPHILVKFDNPVIKSYTGEKSTFMLTSTKQKKRERSANKTPIKAKTTDGYECEDVGVDKQVAEILAAVIPPIEWEDDGRLYHQEMSTAPASRTDLIELQEKLDKLLKQKQAREDGICPVRRELYTQVFDELIRQAVIDSPERGLLLVRVRDEVRMTLKAYEALHESGTAFGLNKTAETDTFKTDLQVKRSGTSIRKQELERTLLELKTKLELADRTFQDQQEADARKHAEAMQFAKRSHQALKQQLEGLIGPVLPEPDDFAEHCATVFSFFNLK